MLATHLLNSARLGAAPLFLRIIHRKKNIYNKSTILFVSPPMVVTITVQKKTNACAVNNERCLKAMLCNCTFKLMLKLPFLSYSIIPS